MRSRVSICIVVVSVLALVAATGAFAAADRSLGRKGAFSPAVERLDGGTLALDMNVPYERAELTLSGPGGVRVTRKFAGGEAIALQLVDRAGDPLANGSYRYSLRISPRPEDFDAFKTGMFFVRDGAAVSRQTRRTELRQTREALNFERFERSKQARTERPDNPELYANYGFAGGIDIFDYYPNSPYLWFYQYGNGQFYYAGGISTYSYYGPGPDYYLYNSLSTYGETWNNIYAGYGTWIEAGYNFTIGALNYDRAFGYFYYGYPLYGGFTTMSAFGYDYGYQDGYFQNLVVMPFGVGVGTYFPTADMEIADYDFAAMRLYSYLGSTWAFSSTPYGSGEFTVNKIGSGGQEFTVRTRLNASGPTLEVQGSVKGTSFISTSSRDAKTDFRTLDGKEVLAQLSEVPVMSWRFKTEDEDERHVGPVAEDFQAAFQLGDGKTITNIDADGVAMAAIQGLHTLLQEKDQQITDLAKRLAALEERLQAHPPGGS